MPLATVLVVEDDPLVRSFLRAALEDRVRVLEVEDGEAALDVLARRLGERVALALVDQVIPKRSGLDVVREARRRWPWVPVVLITGFGSEEILNDAFRLGASVVLSKPFAIEDLRRVVACFLAPGAVQRR